MMGQPKVVLKHVFDHIGIGDLELCASPPPNPKSLIDFCVPLHLARWRNQGGLDRKASGSLTCALTCVAAEDQWGAVLANINVEKSDAKLDGVHGTSYGTSTLGDDTAKLLHRFFAPHNLVRWTACSGGVVVSRSGVVECIALLRGHGFVPDRCWHSSCRMTHTLAGMRGEAAAGPARL